MPSADQIRSKLDKALSRFKLTDRDVYKRVTTRTGGDPLIGRNGSVTVADTLLNPTPAVEVIGAGHPLLVGSTLIQVGDYRLVISKTALTREELRNKDLSLVFKDADIEEECVVISYSPLVLGGAVIYFDVVARSKKR